MNNETSHRPRLTNRDKALAVAGLITAILFIVGGELDVYWLRMVTKPIPVLCMAAWVAGLPTRGRYQVAVIVGLVLSALGDFLLEMSPGTFIFGLVAFLLGHIAYVVAFAQDSRKFFPVRALLAYGYAIAIYAYLMVAGDLGAMTIPVLFYVTVICTMLWRAASRIGAPGVQKRSAQAGLIGALFFTLSDTILALKMFAAFTPPIPHLVILTYWLGQLGIMLSAGWQRGNDHSSL